MEKSDVERLGLHLRKPTPDPVYRALGNDPNEIREDWLERHDRITGFMLGARERDFELSNESARAVIALYQQSEHPEFLDTLLIQSIKGNNCLVVGAVIVHLGLTTPLWQALSSDQWFSLMLGLKNALEHCPRMPTNDALDFYKKWFDKYIIHVAALAEHNKSDQDQYYYGEAGKLGELIEDILRFRDRHLLLGGNPALDRDRRELIDRLAKLSVAPEIRALLDSADKDAESGDFKGAMEKCRTFLERTYEACCRRHKAPAGTKPIPEKNAGGSIAPWLQWATETGLLRPKEQAVVQALSSFIAIEGSHAPLSEPRQYLVAKTCVVEWCLLAADRVS